MNQEMLDAIKARTDAATKSPWIASDTDLAVATDDGRTLIPLAEVLLSDEDTREDHPQALADAEFVAHARTDIPALLAEVERLREHSITLNSIGWRIAVALGDVPEGVDRIEGNPGEQADRLIAEVERLRAVEARCRFFAELWEEDGDPMFRAFGGDIRRALDGAS